MNLTKIRSELAWLKKNPAFDERPATLAEFLGPDYLNIEKGVRKAVRAALVDIMGDEVTSERITKYPLAMITGGIGIGKTTIASIVLPYLCHYVLCLRDPQDFYDLLPGSRIAFMQMSTTEDQAVEVVFGDIKARITHSPWFSEKYPYDPTFKKQIRFEKDIWILPGDSMDTTFEGYNILGGILDEADSHKVTERKDYAQDGYNTIHARISSRFQERGFLLVIGQMKKQSGFAARTYAAMKADPNAYAVRMAIWESFGWEKYMKRDEETGEMVRDSFWYDTKRKQIVPPGVVSVVDNSNLIEIPNVYRKDFENNPEKALKDLAGIPPAVGDPFISLAHKIDEARDRWLEHHPGFTSPVDENPTTPRIAPWFRALETLKRVGHLDIGVSAKGDAAGFAMGHVREVVEIDGELKPYIVIDMLYRIKAPAGGEIFISELRRLIYTLRDEYGFKLKKITFDGFQSTDTDQQLRKRRFSTELVSVDKQVLPYHDLREAIYEDRIEFPQYMTYLNRGDEQQVEIAVKELTELEDHIKKIDHPESGSKDVADAIAGVVYTLMGDRSFRRNVVSLESARSQRAVNDGNDLYAHPALRGMNNLRAPVPNLTNLGDYKRG